MLSSRYDEGPSFNWPPSEVFALSMSELEYFCGALKRLREQYAEQMKKLMNKE